MNTHKLTKVNYLLTNAIFHFWGGGLFNTLIIKGLQGFNKILKDYEITNRNISNFS